MTLQHEVAFESRNALRIVISSPVGVAVSAFIDKLRSVTPSSPTGQAIRLSYDKRIVIRSGSGRFCRQQMASNFVEIFGLLARFSQRAFEYVRCVTQFGMKGFQLLHGQ
jgi:hypothetical protein